MIDKDLTGYLHKLNLFTRLEPSRGGRESCLRLHLKDSFRLPRHQPLGHLYLYSLVFPATRVWVLHFVQADEFRLAPLIPEAACTRAISSHTSRL